MTKKEKQTTYVERDVSWMYFNHRILQEAEKPTVPLLERLSFLGIYSNNLDDFSACVWLRSTDWLITSRCPNAIARPYARH